jgi:hypothetical protein
MLVGSVNALEVCLACELRRTLWAYKVGRDIEDLLKKHSMHEIVQIWGVLPLQQSLQL